MSVTAAAAAAVAMATSDALGCLSSVSVPDASCQRRSSDAATDRHHASVSAIFPSTQHCVSFTLIIYSKSVSESFDCGLCLRMLSTVYPLKVKKGKGKDVNLYMYKIPLMRISSLKLSRRAIFRSPYSLQTQPCAVTQQPATGSASQLVWVSTFVTHH